MQKRKSNPVGIYIVLVLSAITLIGGLKVSAFLNKASIQGVRYTAGIFPVSSWGWGSTNWKGQRSLDVDEAVDTDEALGMPGKSSGGVILHHYHSIAYGPVLVIKQTTEYQF